MFENTNTTEIADLGEFGLINHLTQHINLNSKHTQKGVGDDAAVIDALVKKILFSTDLLL